MAWSQSMETMAIYFRAKPDRPFPQDFSVLPLLSGQQGTDHQIVDHGKEICFPSGMEKMGPVTQKLYETLTGIQMGRIEAPEGWIRKIL